MNKRNPSNKSIVKPAILNQPKIKLIKQQKKEIRDRRRRALETDEDEEMQTSDDESDNEINNEDENKNSDENNNDIHDEVSEKNYIEIDDENNNENKNKNNNNNVENNNKNENEIKNENENKTKNNNKNSNKIVNEENKIANKEIEKKDKPKNITKRNMTEIQLLEKDQKFNILTETKNLYPKINLAQLLSVSPALRKELEQGLKPRVEKIICSITGTSIPIIIGECCNTSLKILFDTGANINIITQESFDKLKNKIKYKNDKEIEIKLADSTIIYSNYHTTLKIKINDNLIINDTFYIIDYTNFYYDIIIGRSIQKKYRLFIDPDDDSIYQKNDNNKFSKITEIINNKINTPLLNAIIITKEEQQEFNNTLEEIINNVPNEIKDEFKQLIINNKNCMATSLSQLSLAKLEPHSIPTTTNKPIKLKPYKLSKEHSDILKNEILSLLNKGLIQPSHSPWAFPVLLVQKKNGKWRMCIDYRKLNNITIKDSYALPFIDELISSVKGAKIFSALDLFSGYHQIPMNKEDIEKTSFTTKFGNYNFLVMPFGLTNAPASFQREMNRILLPLIGECLFVYIDDIVVYSKDIKEHIKHLRQVFEIFSKYNLSINLQKCQFFKKEVEVLGHVLTADGLKTSPNKVQNIALWKRPTNINELRSFLGLTSYYRKFIKNFSIRASPLFKLLKKNSKFTWNEKCNNAFEDLRQCLLEDPILIYPNFNKPFIIRTDASTKGIGGVILQEEEDRMEHPISCVSRSLKPAEENYSITDLEGLALIYTLKKFRQYIISNKNSTIFITDHKPLIGFFNKSLPVKGRHMRWIEEFNKYNITIKYEKGKRNVFADALSRLPSKSNEGILLTINSILNDFNPKDLDLPEGIRKYFSKNYQVIDNTLYYKKNDMYLKVIYRDEDKKDIIDRAHSVGHEGAEKTTRRIMQSYYWPGIWHDVKMWVKSCHKCQLFRPKPQAKNTEDHITPVERPFTRVGLDIVGPLPTTKQGNNYIITLVDYFTKWPEAKAIPNIKSEEVIKFLVEVIARHGPPELIITDNGSSFISDITKMMIDLYGSWVHFISPHHPQSNGMIENRNKEIGKMLRLLLEGEQEWDECLPSVLWALRTSKNSKTKFNSFELLYGRKETWPMEIMFPDIYQEEGESEEEYNIRRFLRHYKWVKEAIGYSEYANKYWEHRIGFSKALKRKYKIGDYVMIRLINRTKLDPYFYGPFKVVTKPKFNTIVLEDPQTGKLLPRNVHIKNVYPYTIREENINTSRDEVSS